MKIKLTLVILMSFILLLSSQSRSDAQNSQPSFSRLLGETAWEINLSDCGFVLEQGGKVFNLRIQDKQNLEFSAYLKTDRYSTQFGMLHSDYTEQAAQLRDYALTFADLPKDQHYNMKLAWALHPESISRWAQYWHTSGLWKKWKKIQPEDKKLRKEISDFIQADFNPVLQKLGFAITAVDMEKMTLMSAKHYRYYQTMLQPAGIPDELKFPLPMMMSLTLKSVPLPEENNPEPEKQAADIKVNQLFITAKKNSTTIYATYKQDLDEYELTGTSDTTNESIVPLTTKKYWPISSQLLKAMLAATTDQNQTTASIRINLSRYPKAYQEVVKYVNSSGVKQKLKAITRPETRLRHFYEYKSISSAGFQEGLVSFFEQLGYKALALQLSLVNKSKASSDAEYERLLKPLGYQPDQSVELPDMVYLIVEKSRLD